MLRNHHARILLFAVLGTLLAGSDVAAQIFPGRVTGTVRDEQGATVAGATPRRPSHMPTRANWRRKSARPDSFATRRSRSWAPARRSWKLSVARCHAPWK